MHVIYSRIKCINYVRQKWIESIITNWFPNWISRIEKRVATKILGSKTKPVKIDNPDGCWNLSRIWKRSGKKSATVETRPRCNFPWRVSATAIRSRTYRKREHGSRHASVARGCRVETIVCTLRFDTGRAWRLQATHSMPRWELLTFSPCTGEINHAVAP